MRVWQKTFLKFNKTTEPLALELTKWTISSKQIILKLKVFLMLRIKKVTMAILKIINPHINGQQIGTNKKTYETKHQP